MQGGRGYTDAGETLGVLGTAVVSMVVSVSRVYTRVDSYQTVFFMYSLLSANHISLKLFTKTRNRYQRSCGAGRDSWARLFDEPPASRAAGFIAILISWQGQVGTGELEGWVP